GRAVGVRCYEVINNPHTVKIVVGCASNASVCRNLSVARNAAQLLLGGDGCFSKTLLNFCGNGWAQLLLVVVVQALGSPTAEEPVEQSSLDGAILIVPSPRGFIQASDDMDGEPVLPLTTLTDPILQHHGENSHVTGSSLDSPSSEDSKGMENLVSCH
uniref:Uncharacterized protein n=1 Tax=Naja naja TaxID=35670 RepID=A0A8C6XPS0_NAJNA